MSRSALAFLVLTACAPHPDYVSTHGAAYYFQGRHWAPEQIDAQEAYFVGNVPSPWTSVLAATTLARSTVYLMPPGFDCSTGDWFHHCAGLQLSGMLEVADLGCPGNSFTMHEVTHWMQERAGVFDYSHADTALWQAVNPRSGSCE